MDDVNVLVEKSTDLLFVWGPKLLLALITLVVGLIVVSWLIRLLDAVMQKRDFDPTLRPFLRSLLRVILMILLLISVAGMVGIQTTSFIAVIGAAGLAIGLALQGSLSNFAGGVLILIFKPFKVGDFIEGQGRMGTVLEITILYTILRTPENQRVYIPNGQLANNHVMNFSAEQTRRGDLIFGIHYDDDISKAKDIIRQVFTADERVLEDPALNIFVSELADSSVNITARYWTNTPDFWNFRFEVVEKVKVEFDRQGITIPFPQRDVHMYREKVN